MEKSLESGVMSEVNVDYDTHEIKLSKRHAPKFKFLKFTTLYFPYLTNLVFFIFFPFFLYSSIYFSFKYDSVYSAKLFIIQIMIIFIASILLYIPHLFKLKRADKVYAKLNTVRNETKRIKITNFPSKNMLIYPINFKNIYAHYKLYGDASKHIKNFKVVKMNGNDSVKNMNKFWGINLVFNKLVKKGIMEIKYI